MAKSSAPRATGQNRQVMAIAFNAYPESSVFNAANERRAVQRLDKAGWMKITYVGKFAGQQELRAKLTAKGKRELERAFTGTAKVAAAQRKREKLEAIGAKIRKAEAAAKKALKPERQYKIRDFVKVVKTVGPHKKGATGEVYDVDRHYVYVAIPNRETARYQMHFDRSEIRPLHANGSKPTKAKAKRAKARKINAYSVTRWRASASEKRAHGGSTVTKFFVEYDDDISSRREIVGYGASPSARKKYAIDLFKKLATGEVRKPVDKKPPETRMPARIEKEIEDIGYQQGRMGNNFDNAEFEYKRRWKVFPKGGSQKVLMTAWQRGRREWVSATTERAQRAKAAMRAKAAEPKPKPKRTPPPKGKTLFLFAHEDLALFGAKKRKK